jgi:DNA ligase-1
VLSKADTDARRLIHYALNPYKVFGVKKFDKPSSYSSDPELKRSKINDFILVLDQLDRRELTGDAARDAVTHSLSLFNEEHAKFMELVIDKDVQAGFSAETFTKIWKDKDEWYGTIPSFEVMLADKCESVEEFEKYIKFPCIAQHKADGQRTIATVIDGVVTYFARSGKISEHLNGLFDEELIRFSRLLSTDIVVDGETFAGSFTETMNAKKEGKSAAKDNMRFCAFFVMPYSDWQAKTTKITMRQALDILAFELPKIKPQKIIAIESREVQNYKDMMDYCNEVIDVHKQEGLILKNYDSPYVWERSISWCKVKRMWDVDGQIYDMYAGKTKSRLENMLGGICVKGVDEKGTEFDVNVGSGFSDEQRKEIWNNRDKYIGKTVTIKFQEYSKNKATNTLSLRFPVFMHFRDDK